MTLQQPSRMLLPRLEVSVRLPMIEPESLTSADTLYHKLWIQPNTDDSYVKSLTSMFLDSIYLFFAQLIRRENQCPILGYQLFE
jgi:hypothetical protein